MKTVLNVTALFASGIMIVSGVLLLAGAYERKFLPVFWGSVVVLFVVLIIYCLISNSGE